MKYRQRQKKNIITKLLEKGIKILLKKECKKISKIEIDIFASSLQIIRGTIEKIFINAEDINYKDLLFDAIKLEANDVKIKFKINNKELNIINNLILKFQISLSETSLKIILSSKNWNWIRDEICKGILNNDFIKDIKLKDNHFFIESSSKNNNLVRFTKVDIKAVNGKVYLENKEYNKSIEIPIEDKIFIQDVKIINNLINIFAESSVIF